MEGTALPGLDLNFRGRWIYGLLPQMLKLMSLSSYFSARGSRCCGRALSAEWLGLRKSKSKLGPPVGHRFGQTHTRPWHPQWSGGPRGGLGVCWPCMRLLLFCLYIAYWGKYTKPSKLG